MLPLSLHWLLLVGWFSFHVTAQNDVRAIRFLFNMGSDPDHQTSNGTTPLMYAARFCQVDSIKELMVCGCRLELKDDEGRNAAWWALDAGDVPMAKLLQPRVPDAPAIAAMDPDGSPVAVRKAVEAAEGQVALHLQRPASADSQAAQPGAGGSALVVAAPRPPSAAFVLDRDVRGTLLPETEADRAAAKQKKKKKKKKKKRKRKKGQEEEEECVCCVVLYCVLACVGVCWCVLACVGVCWCVRFSSGRCYLARPWRTRTVAVASRCMVLLSLLVQCFDTPLLFFLCLFSVPCGWTVEQV